VNYSGRDRLAVIRVGEEIFGGLLTALETSGRSMAVVGVPCVRMVAHYWREPREAGLLGSRLRRVSVRSRGPTEVVVLRRGGSGLGSRRG